MTLAAPSAIAAAKRRRRRREPTIPCTVTRRRSRRRRALRRRAWAIEPRQDANGFSECNAGTVIRRCCECSGNSERFPGPLYRKCSCAGSGGASGECARCAGKGDESLSRKAARGASPGGVPAIVNDVLRSSGEALDPGTRDFMEPRFGADLSAVRVHTGTQAEESAVAVHALAYTVGRDIVFAAGPATPRAPVRGAGCWRMNLRTSCSNDH